MSVLRPPFSERVFEFSFNAEFAEHYHGVLVSAPDIPTQNAEKALGYDAMFEIEQRGGAIHSLALQHKVARLVDGKSGSNARFRKHVDVPYFRFDIDSEQFNVIQAVASAGLPGVDFFYCAPLFADYKSLNASYKLKTVMAHTLWISLGNAKALDVNESHSIVYSADGSSAFLFSEPQQLLPFRKYERSRQIGDKQIESADFRRLYEGVYARVSEGVRAARVRRERERRAESLLPDELPVWRVVREPHDAIAGLSELLTRYLGLTWIVEVPD